MDPTKLDGFEAAERSAQAARIQLFGEKFSKVVALLQDLAKHANGHGMDIAVRTSQELKRDPTVLNRMHLHLVSLWTSHHLWLTNDRDGSRYLEGLSKEGMSQEESKKVEVTEDAYEKAWRYKFRLSKPYKSLRFRIFTDGRVEIEDGEK